eukprot:2256475-Rhodomonas_salina.1
MRSACLVPSEAKCLGEVISLRGVVFVKSVGVGLVSGLQGADVFWEACVEGDGEAPFWRLQELNQSFGWWSRSKVLCRAAVTAAALKG